MMTDPGVLMLISLIINGLLVPFIAYYIRKLEKNTNSIKDQLVKVTGESEHAKGVKEEKDRVREKEKGD